MQIREFVQKNSPKWEEYRQLLTRASGVGLRRMSPGEIDRLVWLYRSVTGDLAKARSLWPDTAIERDLNSLASQGYSIIYQHGGTGPTRFIEFITDGFPRAVRRNFRFIMASLLISVVFTVAGTFAHRIDERLPATIIPGRMLEHFQQELEENGRVDRDISFQDRSMFSSFLITNNIRVSFNAFATGILFGIGTIYILALNGMVLGCIGLEFHAHGQLLNFLAFVMPHGVIELCAIIISGAAGLRLGYALLNPGEATRGESLKNGAAEAIELIFGVVVMLVIAGIIEGFFTPIKWIPDWTKLVFSGLLFSLLLIYLSRGFRNENEPQGARPPGARFRKSGSFSVPGTY